MQHYSTTIIAQAYGSGSYDTSTYGGSNTNTAKTSPTYIQGNPYTTATPKSGDSFSALVHNPSFDVALSAAVICLGIFIWLILGFWRRRKKDDNKNNFGPTK